MVVIKEYPGDLLVRSAQVGDLDAVMQIEVFGELDHIRAMYDTYMEHPDYHAFVGEINGRVIAFCYVHIVDSGETVYRGGKRIHQDFRSKGYLSKFIDPVEDFVSALFPAVKRWRYIAGNTEYQKKQIPVFREAGVLLKFVVRNYFLTVSSQSDLRDVTHRESVQKLAKEYGVSCVVHVEKGKIPDSLLNPTIQANLFPQESVIICNESYSAVQSSLQYIMDTTECFITYSGDAQSKVKAVSFISEILTNESTLRRDTEMYVNNALPRDEQIRCVKQHIVNACLQQSSRYQTASKIYMLFTFPECFIVNDMKNWFLENIPGVSSYNQVQNFSEDTYILCEYDREKWVKLQQSKAH